MAPQDHTLDLLQRNRDYQEMLLWPAVMLLRPGGTLVYSTCTLDPLENEGMVRHALDRFPQLRLVEQGMRLGGPGLCGAGITDEERGCDPRARAAACRGY